MLAAVPVAAPASWAIVAFTKHCGNGIRIDEVSTRILGRRTAPFHTFPYTSRVPHGVTQDPSTGSRLLLLQATGLLYTSTEGDWLPGSGAVYEIDPAARPWGGAAHVLADRLDPADGLWIDQVSTRILGRRTAPFYAFPYFLTASRVVLPKILVLTRACCCCRRAPRCTSGCCRPLGSGRTTWRRAPRSARSAASSTTAASCCYAPWTTSHWPVQSKIRISTRILG